MAVRPRPCRSMPRRRRKSWPTSACWTATSTRYQNICRARRAGPRRSSRKNRDGIILCSLDEIFTPLARRGRAPCGKAAAGHGTGQLPAENMSPAARSHGPHRRAERGIALSAATHLSSRTVAGGCHYPGAAVVAVTTRSVATLTAIAGVLWRPGTTDDGRSPYTRAGRLVTRLQRPYDAHGTTADTGAAAAPATGDRIAGGSPGPQRRSGGCGLGLAGTAIAAAEHLLPGSGDEGAGQVATAWPVPATWVTCPHCGSRGHRLLARYPQ